MILGALSLVKKIFWDVLFSVPSLPPPLATFVRELSFANFRLGSFAWKLSFGILRLGFLVGTFQYYIMRGFSTRNFQYYFPTVGRGS